MSVEIAHAEEALVAVFADMRRAVRVVLQHMVLQHGGDGECLSATAVSTLILAALSMLECLVQFEAQGCAECTVTLVTGKGLLPRVLPHVHFQIRDLLEAHFTVAGSLRVHPSHVCIQTPLPCELHATAVAHQTLVLVYLAMTAESLFRFKHLPAFIAFIISLVRVLHFVMPETAVAWEALATYGA